MPDVMVLVQGVSSRCFDPTLTVVRHIRAPAASGWFVDQGVSVVDGVKARLFAAVMK